MVRPKRYELPNQARFLTWSCWQRTQLLANPQIRDAFVEQLDTARSQHRFALLGWVVMPEHVHLLVLLRVDGPSMGEILRAIKEPLARRVIRRWRELEAPVLTKVTDSNGRTRFWQRGGGYDRTIRTREELEEKLVYVHKNPVRRGLAERPEDWAWSSAGWYAGERTAGIAIDAIP